MQGSICINGLVRPLVHFQLWRNGGVRVAQLDATWGMKNTSGVKIKDNWRQRGPI